MIAGHEFYHVYDFEIDGMKDLDLIPWMADNDFGGIITQDRGQLRDDDERRELIASNIHWIGRTPPKLNGMKLVAASAATYVSAFPEVIEGILEATQPMIFRIKNIPYGKNQRVKPAPLRY